MCYRDARQGRREGSAQQGSDPQFTHAIQADMIAFQQQW